jgi:hypothetical protein
MVSEMTNLILFNKIWAAFCRFGSYTKPLLGEFGQFKENANNALKAIKAEECKVTRIIIALIIFGAFFSSFLGIAMLSVIIVLINVLRLITEIWKIVAQHMYEKCVEWHIMNVAKVSIVYTLRHGLCELEGFFGLFPVGNKGFQSVNATKNDCGVWIIGVNYSRLPDLPEMELSEQTQLRKVINSNLSDIVSNLPYESVRRVDFYVEDIKAKDGVLTISAVPLIDDVSSSYVANHQAITTEQTIIGGKENTLTMSRGGLEDDEI